MQFLLKFVLMTSLVFSLCAATGGAKNITNPKVNPYASKFISKLEKGEKVTIVFLGDSVTEQNATTNGEPNHVGLLKVWMEQRYPKQVTVINAGISGNTIAAMWRRLYKDVVVHKPDLVIVSSGLNDYGGSAKVTLDDYRNNYELLIQEILSSSESDIIIRTSNPTQNPTFNTGMEPFIKASVELSQKYHLGLFNLYEEMQSDIKDKKVVHKNLMNDTIHPSAEGHDYIFRLFKKYFEPRKLQPIRSYKMLNGKTGFNFNNTGAIEANNVNFMNGKVISYSTPSRYIEASYDGSDFSLIYTGAKGSGTFVVSIDGKSQPLVDTYRAVTSYRQYISYSVPYGKHIIRIENKGKQHPSTGSLLMIEGIIYNSAKQ